MTINWGIIGAGKIAERQMVSAMWQAHDQRLAAIMRRDADAARDFATRHNVPRWYNNVEDLVADDELDAVYVATPPNAHLDNVRQAAEHGKHILCEKPMALNPAEAQAIIDVCRANDVQLMICYYQRYNARHQRIKQLVEEGAIGQVTAVRVNFSGLNPPSSSGWHHDPAISGGGPLMDVAPHCLDLIRYLVAPVVEVKALVDTLASDSPVEDTATLLLRLANGAQAVVTTHWSTANYPGDRFNEVVIQGTSGSIVAAPISSKDSSGTLRLFTEDSEQVFDVAPGGPRPHVALLEDFAAALANNSPMPIPGEDGLADMKIIGAALAEKRETRD